MGLLADVEGDSDCPRGQRQKGLERMHHFTADQGDGGLEVPAAVTGRASSLITMHMASAALSPEKAQVTCAFMLLPASVPRQGVLHPDPSSPSFSLSIRTFFRATISSVWVSRARSATGAHGKSSRPQTVIAPPGHLGASQEFAEMLFPL